MHASQSAQFRRYQLFANVASLPAPDSPNLQTGDRAFAIAESFAFELQGAPGARVWAHLATDATTIPAGQVVFGGVSGGLTSSPLFQIDPTAKQFAAVSPGGERIMSVGVGTGAEFFEIDSGNGNELLRVDARVGHQATTVYDATGIPMLTADAVGREIKEFDSAGIKITDSFTAFRACLVYDEASNAFMEYVATVATRQAAIFDVAGAIALVQVDTSALTKSTQLKDDGGTTILAVIQKAATKRATLSIPLTLASFTVAALPTPPNGGAGSIAWASNGRVGAEGAGAGTGSMVQYKTAGPAGAGWYIPGAIVLVTA